MNPGLGFCCLLLFSVVYADADVQTSDTPLISSSLSPSPPSSQNSPSTSTTWTTATSPQLTSTPSSTPPPPPPPPPPTPTTTDTPCYSSICQCEENFFQDGTACSNVSRLKVTNITATFVGETYITLGWTNPNDIKPNVTYTVQGHSWNSSMDRTITGLRPGHVYEIIITSSITQYNVTKQVNSTPVYIRTYPSQVTVLNNPARKVPASNLSLTFNISDGEASCYIITVKHQNMVVFNMTVHDNTTETIKTRIENLESAKTYNISIITVSGNRHSNALTFPFTTKDKQAGIITRFNVTNVTNTSISVSWSPPSETRGSIIGYSLNVSSGPIDQDFQLLLICSNCSYIQKTLKLHADVGMNISLNINKDVQYTIQNLLPFENYTLTVNAYNEAGQGETYLNRTRTSIGVPSPPKELDVFNISSSSVTLFWQPADHQDGPTTYYITVGEATHLTSNSFQEKMVVSVSGFNSTSVLVEGLLSYWKYTFNITAATPVGNSSVLSVNETVRIQESALG
ncbi:phosphatidylinositol phosphatase PTPRQ-like [Haliotis rubra]|uniref:phosphatidylinositol phosphatase PTPRQ-like n=1 Tax=Haliotis rubra TaxID=36100 RepID=UPI001EE53275|nr:phosphatidylinositol phosphatase PTPRQ-like [Haliotis rubra]